MTARLTVSRQVSEAMCRWGEAGYPEEACGILTGVWAPRRIEALVPSRNVLPSRRESRFEMDPRDYLRVEREADGRGRTVVGFMHSHPDTAAIPSGTDATFAEGWPEFTTAIVEVSRGRARGIRWWRWDPFRRAFTEDDAMIITGSRSAGHGMNSHTRR